jgi:bacteriophage HK97-gp10 putative tail-component
MANAAQVLSAATVRRGAEIMGRARGRMETAVRRAAPVSPGYPGAPRPGRLRDSVEASVRRHGDEYVITIRATAEHAIFTIVPTRRHPISPRRARGLLVFYWPVVGDTVYRRHVEHPGTTPSGWWERALARFGEVLRESQ